MHNPARLPLESAMGFAPEIRRKIQWASAAQLFPVINTFVQPLARLRALPFQLSSYRFFCWTMVADEQEDVRRAEDLVLEARRIVQQQKGRIIRLRAAGVDTWDAERTLRTLESNLKRFEEHGDSLKRK